MSRNKKPSPKTELQLRRQRVEQAFEQVLQALGVEPNEEFEGTPARAAALWCEHLLQGEGVDLGKVLGRGTPTTSSAPVSVTHLGVHLVCPHHLTVAFGECHVAYHPGNRLVGFGNLASLARMATAKFILQEDATQCIADTLVQHLEARAAVAVIDAVHPCHNVTHPRSHRARAVTWASAGNRKFANELRRIIGFSTEKT